MKDRIARKVTIDKKVRIAWKAMPFWKVGIARKIMAEMPRKSELLGRLRKRGRSESPAVPV